MTVESCSVSFTLLFCPMRFTCKYSMQLLIIALYPVYIYITFTLFPSFLKCFLRDIFMGMSSGYLGNPFEMQTCLDLTEIWQPEPKLRWG